MSQRRGLTLSGAGAGAGALVAAPAARAAHAPGHVSAPAAATPPAPPVAQPLDAYGIAATEGIARRLLGRPLPRIEPSPGT